jgi:calcium-dependent protein kinase
MGCCQSSAATSPPSPAQFGGQQPKADETKNKNGTSTSSVASSTVPQKMHQKQQNNNPFSIVDRLPPKPDSTKRNEILQHLLVEKKRDFCDYYDVVKQIGKGSISNIYLVVKKKSVDTTPSLVTGKDSTLEQPTEPKEVLYAVKEIDASLVNREFENEMRNEIKLLRALDHPNIERIYEVYKHPTSGFLSIIMDYCSGGDLNARKPYTESQARSIVLSLCEALNYMHSPTPDVVIHRDIKFENIMFESSAEDAQIKLIDFGLSAKYAYTMLNGKVGTAYTMAPEVIREESYDTKADMWSVGVVTYQLIAGKAPFWSANGIPADVMELVVKGSYNFDGPEWRSVSADAKSFVSKLLKLEPWNRMSALQSLHHPWLKSLAYPRKEDIDYDFIAKCYDNAREYATLSDFHKLALQAVARKTTTEEIVKLRQAFHALDADNSGAITYQEMRSVLGTMYPTRDIKDLFAKMDVDESGSIHYTEFLAATMGVNGEISERRIQEAFDLFDTDDSGFISRENLRKMLGKDAEESFVEQLLNEADQDHNGRISFEEFKLQFRVKHKEVAVDELNSAS